VYSPPGAGNETQVRNTRRADIKGKAGKEERLVSPCVLSSSMTVHEVVDLFEAKDDMVLIGEIAIILLALSVSLELGGELLEQEVDKTGTTQAGKRSARRAF
jgi:hypothetical protein